MCKSLAILKNTPTMRIILFKMIDLNFSVDSPILYMMCCFVRKRISLLISWSIKSLLCVKLRASEIALVFLVISAMVDGDKLEKTEKG